MNLEGRPADESVVRVYETGTGKEIRRLATGKFGIHCLVFSTSGKTLAAGGKDGLVCFWDLMSGEQIGMLKGQPGDAPATTLAFADDDRILAVAGTDRIVRIYELATRRERLRFTGAPNCYALAFDPGGKRLSSGYFNTTALIWDVSGANDIAPRIIALTEERRNALWEDMRGQDAIQAYQAIKELAREPQQAVLFLRKQIRLVADEDMARIDGLILDLDSDSFATRQKATTQLKKLGAAAADKLSKALQNRPSVELRGRLQQLLTALERQMLEADALRTVRAIEILERVGTDEARQTLEALAQRSVGHQPAEQARAALQRLEKRAPVNRLVLGGRSNSGTRPVLKTC